MSALKRPLMLILTTRTVSYGSVLTFLNMCLGPEKQGYGAKNLLYSNEAKDFASKVNYFILEHLPLQIFRHSTVPVKTQNEHLIISSLSQSYVIKSAP